MIITGYRANADFTKAQGVLKKHTKYSSSDIRNIVATIQEGQAVKLPDDFVLREDLEELNFLID